MGLASAIPLLALAAGTAVVVFLLLTERGRTAERFTEFYLLGPEGTAAGYPAALRVGEEAFVTVGLTNREGEETVYHVSLLVNGERRAEIGPLALASGERWESPVGLTLREAGRRQPVQFLLYRQGNASPYRALRLWVDGTGPSKAAGAEQEPQRAEKRTEAGPQGVEQARPLFHVVSPGDNLTLISQRYGVALARVIEANAAGVPDPNLIYPGQRILIPREAP